MRMRIFDRILLTLYTLFVILLSLALLGIALNMIDYNTIVNLLSDATYGWPALILGAIAVALFLASIRLLVAGYTGKKANSVVLMNSGGCYKVSVIH